MKSVWIATALALAVSACATAPDRIVARPADAGVYAGLSCDQLASQQNDVQNALSGYEAAQRRTRRVDQVGVALVFLPIGSLTGGNHARQIADLRGRSEALHDQQHAMQCGAGAPGDAPLVINEPSAGR
ncbi:MAG TPA: hypothetical protein VG943_13555 [Caulobacterales bacterium]|nr:hypothetical protein [Caulobacterales bacterium]